MILAMVSSMSERPTIAKVIAGDCVYSENGDYKAVCIHCLQPIDMDSDEYYRLSFEHIRHTLQEPDPRYYFHMSCFTECKSIEKGIEKMILLVREKSSYLSNAFCPKCKTNLKLTDERLFWCDVCERVYETTSVTDSPTKFRKGRPSTSYIRD